MVALSQADSTAVSHAAQVGCSQPEAGEIARRLTCVYSALSV